MVSRIIAMVVAIVATLLGAPSSEAASSPTALVITCAYDGHHQSATTASTTSGRGPPSLAYTNSASHTVDLRPHGAAVRVEQATPSATITCDDTSVLAQAARATPTTREQVGRSGGDLCSPGSRAVAAKTADDWPILSGIVRDATRGKGNFGIGSGTASQATRAGKSWVGEGYRIASDGKTLVSRDGLRTNGHLDITDMGP